MKLLVTLLGPSGATAFHAILHERPDRIVLVTNANAKAEWRRLVEALAARDVSTAGVDVRNLADPTAGFQEARLLACSLSERMRRDLEVVVTLASDLPALQYAASELARIVGAREIAVVDRRSADEQARDPFGAAEVVDVRAAASPRPGARVRMVAFIDDQPLVNFILVNEQATRPAALHGLYTRATEKRWAALKAVLRRRFPDVEICDGRYADAYAPRPVRSYVEALMAKHPDAAWCLNATGGSKLMTGPVIELFHERGLPVYYVDVECTRVERVRGAWLTESIPLRGTIGVGEYFGLFGRGVAFGGKPVTGQESEILKHLRQLNWEVEGNVRLLAQGRFGAEAEYDAVAVRGYQPFFFECKRLSKGGLAEAQATSVRNDLLKLHELRQSFGGPLGRSIWVLSGGYQLSEADRDELRHFGIQLVRGQDIAALGTAPERFGLPPVRGQSTAPAPRRGHRKRTAPAT
jgi:hypothetical protein